jgi:hypothetical protein
MIALEGNITNMKKRPTFMEESSMASRKDLNFDMCCKNFNTAIAKS